MQPKVRHSGEQVRRWEGEEPEGAGGPEAGGGPALGPDSEEPWILIHDE